MPLPALVLVVARDKNGVIGKGGDLPWRLRSDLQRFKAVTIGKPCIMGRNTWESLPLRPLPGRLNIVLTRDEGYAEAGKTKGALVVTSLDEAMEIAREQAMEDGVDEICVIGGQALFAAALPRAKRLYITEVQTEVEGGDTWFPPIDAGTFEEISSEAVAPGEKDDHAMVFRVLKRR